MFVSDKGLPVIFGLMCRKPVQMLIVASYCGLSVYSDLNTCKTHLICNWQFKYNSNVSSKHLNAGHHQLASETSFQWQADDVPILCSGWADTQMFANVLIRSCIDLVIY